jgi:hypothetical protein
LFEFIWRADYVGDIGNINFKFCKKLRDAHLGILKHEFAANNKTMKLKKKQKKQKKQ